MDFVGLTEVNEHEGETYRYWIPIEGNEEALATMRRLFGQDSDQVTEEEATYWLATENPLSEEVVDILVDNTRVGYMAFEQKFTGTLVLPPNFEDDFDSILYKGEIKKLFQQV